MTAPRPRLVAKGAWNHTIVVLGVPGTGKSTYAVQRAVELGRTPAYVLAHDPGWRLPTHLPDGRSAELRRYESVAAARAALARDARGIHAIATPSGDDVLRLARELGRASLAAGGGHAGVPVVVVLDEAVATPGASPHRLGDELRELLALRRHLHVGLVINAQSPQFAHYALVGLATEVVMFRLVDERGLRRLESVGVPSEMLARVRGLPNYQHVVFSSEKPAGGHAPPTEAANDNAPRVISRASSRASSRHRNR